MSELTPLAISVSEAVRVSGLGKTSLYSAIAAGRLKIKKSGRRTLVETSELRRFIDDLPDSSLEKAP